MAEGVVALALTGALVAGEEGMKLHPALAPWRRRLLRRRRFWYRSARNLPLSFLAGLYGIEESALIAGAMRYLPPGTRQIWVASPFHARLLRDTVCLLPEGELDFSEDDAQWICNTLNPLLAEEGMTLVAEGAALLLCCREKMRAAPARFDAIAGRLLPDRHPEGEDGGRLMRLVAEIQMHLHHHPAAHRKHRGEHEIHGLWFWSPADADEKKPPTDIRVATRNPFLRSLVDGRDASIVISEVERFGELFKDDAPLPRHILLTGEGHGLLLRGSWWPRMSAAQWIPKNIGPESELIALFRALMGIAR